MIQADEAFSLLKGTGLSGFENWEVKFGHIVEAQASVADFGHSGASFAM